MEIDNAMIDKLVDLLGDFVGADGPYSEKRDRILERVNEEGKINLLEFVSWFDELDGPTLG